MDDNGKDLVVNPLSTGRSLVDNLAVFSLLLILIPQHPPSPSILSYGLFLFLNPLSAVATFWQLFFSTEPT